MSGSPLHIEHDPRGLTVLRLDKPKGNIVDKEMILALRSAVAEIAGRRSTKVILLEAAGKHFSFGASVEEHRPEEAPAMLMALHGLFREALALDLPFVSAVRGVCLGGALELILLSSFIVASEDASFGAPEIKLGVFAPFASAMLPVKVGQAHAERLLLSGASVTAKEAQAMGLVDTIASPPEPAARQLIEERFLPLSGSSLRFAVRAAREVSRTRVLEALDRLERLYLDHLMATPDAREGIAAFIEKRPPKWSEP